jgi:hypothetical protein
MRNGKAIGVAIFDHPANPRQPAYWVADGEGLIAANRFGVRSFTKDSKKNGLFLIPKLTQAAFRYRVVVHEGINARHLRFEDIGELVDLATMDKLKAADAGEPDDDGIAEMLTTQLMNVSRAPVLRAPERQ